MFRKKFSYFLLLYYLLFIIYYLLFFIIYYLLVCILTDEVDNDLKAVEISVGTLVIAVVRANNSIYFDLRFGLHQEWS